MNEKIAIYVRVSTLRQDIEGQERELRSEASRLGFDIVEVYREKLTATGRVEREEYDRLMRDSTSKTRAWSVLLVWSLDRFSREKRFDQSIKAVLDLEELGIQFRSLKESSLNTPSGGKMDFGRSALLALLPVIAAFEAERQKERTQLAMDEFRSGRRKTRSGLPWHPVSRLDDRAIEKMRELRDEGKSFREIGELLGTSDASVRRALKRKKEEIPKGTSSAKMDDVANAR